MLYGVIDIGSNSVRLMVSSGYETLYKKVKITRLAEGMGDDKILTKQAVERTALAVKSFIEQAKQQCVDKLYVFGTAALRQAENRNDFIKHVKDLCDVQVEIISGEREAEIGILGALNGKNGGVIDIGGASTEIIISNNGQKVYSKSVNLGVVKVKDSCGQNRVSAQELINDKLNEFGCVPSSTFYGIGGTATSIAGIMIGEEVYDPKKVNGFVITKGQLLQLVEKLYSMSVEQIMQLKGLQPERANVISGGCLILLSVMEKYDIKDITVSESDNLEGYLISKTEKK